MLNPVRAAGAGPQPPAPSPASPPARPGDDAPAGTPGTGEALCRDCGGSGRLDGQRCKTCEGTGHVNVGVGGG